jgi:alpha-galactosidase
LGLPEKSDPSWYRRASLDTIPYVVIFDLIPLQLSKLSTTQLAIIKNAELLAFHQDATIGVPAAPFTPSGTTATNPREYYVGKSVKGVHVFVINTGSASAVKKFDFASAGLSAASYKVHDMWTGQDVGTFSGSYSPTVGVHDTAAFLLTPA